MIGAGVKGQRNENGETSNTSVDCVIILRVLKVNLKLNKNARNQSQRVTTLRILVNAGSTLTNIDFQIIIHSIPHISVIIVRSIMIVATAHFFLPR